MELCHVEAESTGTLEALGLHRIGENRNQSSSMMEGKANGHRTLNELDLIRMEGEKRPPLQREQKDRLTDGEHEAYLIPIWMLKSLTLPGVFSASTMTVTRN